MKKLLLKLLLAALTALGFTAFTQAETTDKTKEKINQETVQAMNQPDRIESSAQATDEKNQTQTKEKTKAGEEEPECD